MYTHFLNPKNAVVYINQANAAKLIQAARRRKPELHKPPGIQVDMIDLYGEIDTHAGKLGIEYLVVGAMAQDIVLVHYGSTIDRCTRDVAFCINVARL